MLLAVLLGAILWPCSSTLADAELPAPTRLLVDLMAEPASLPTVVVTSGDRPRFSFAVPLHHSFSGAVLPGFYRLVVRRADTSETAWDSGRVRAASAVDVPCGVALQPATAFVWTAQWWWGKGEGGVRSKVAQARFDTGLFTEGDWRGAAWLGAGQTQFRLRVPPMPAATPHNTSVIARLYIASPGGATVDVGTDGPLPGSDSVGLSLWSDFSKAVPYFTFDVSNVVGGGTPAELIVTAGSGFWSSKKNHLSTATGDTPAVKAMLSITTITPNQGSSVTIVTPDRGRVGPVVSDDPWFGAITAVGSEQPWEPVKLAASASPGGPGVSYPAGSDLFPLPTPYANKRLGIQAISVSPGPSHRPGTFLYTFPSNIVGHASVAAGAVSHNSTGNLTLEYCEQWNSTAGGCIPYGFPPYPDPLPTCGNASSGRPGYDVPSGNGCDTFMLSNGSEATKRTNPLSPKFTWHGFQWVLVNPGDGVSFDGKLGSIAAHWTTADLQKSSTFQATGAPLLNTISDIVTSSQLSNLAAYLPTDCPTREKHGWLGDANDVVEEAFVNFWCPSVWSTFLRLIHQSQIQPGADMSGFVSGVVPTKQTSSTLPDKTGHTSGLDVSWSAAFPSIAWNLLLFYGDTASANKYWPSLKSYMHAQLRVANDTAQKERGDGLPDFWTWGDWCAVESRAVCTPGTGRQAAAMNFLLALQAMVRLGDALGFAEDAADFNRTLCTLGPVYNAAFWDESAGTWLGLGSSMMELQTLTAISLAIGADVGLPKERRTRALQALHDDVAVRGFHLTVGSVGQKWLLHVLSQGGFHDTALRLALQESQPSWGHWIAQGATTCWENWSGVADASHPPTPTHNHIFLCGGVGSWLSASVAGMTPTTPGWETVSIKPKVSASLGPSSVTASVMTVRGLVESNWTRVASTRRAGQVVESHSGLQVSLSVSVPPGVISTTVRVPALSVTSAQVTVTLQQRCSAGGKAVVVWAAGRPTTSLQGLHSLVASILVDPSTDEIEVTLERPGCFVLQSWRGGVLTS